VAPPMDANNESAANEAATLSLERDLSGPRGQRWPRRLPLRSRLLLLVVASVVPLIGFSVAREYVDY